MDQRTRSEIMKAAWAKRRAKAKGGKVTVHRRSQPRARVETSPLERAWRISEKVQAMLDELPGDLRGLVLKHLRG